MLLFTCILAEAAGIIRYSMLFAETKWFSESLPVMLFFPVAVAGLAIKNILNVVQLKAALVRIIEKDSLLLK